MPAKQMPKANNKHLEKKELFTYEDGEIFINDKEVFLGGGGHGDYCCGVAEIGEFDFTTNVKYSGPLQEAFNFYVQDKSMHGKRAFIHLTITRLARGKRVPYQPKWFIQCLENYPGASYTEWRKNPNSGNEIQMWVLPV